MRINHKYILNFHELWRRLYDGIHIIQYKKENTWVGNQEFRFLSAWMDSLLVKKRKQFFLSDEMRHTHRLLRCNLPINWICITWYLLLPLLKGNGKLLRKNMVLLVKMSSPFGLNSLSFFCYKVSKWLEWRLKWHWGLWCGLKIKVRTHSILYLFSASRRCNPQKSASFKYIQQKAYAEDTKQKIGPNAQFLQSSWFFNHNT